MWVLLWLVLLIRYSSIHVFQLKVEDVKFAGYATTQLALPSFMNSSWIKLTLRRLQNLRGARKKVQSEQHNSYLMSIIIGYYNIIPGRVNGALQKTSQEALCCWNAEDWSGFASCKVLAKAPGKENENMEEGVGCQTRSQKCWRIGSS